MTIEDQELIEEELKELLERRDTDPLEVPEAFKQCVANLTAYVGRVRIDTAEMMTIHGKLQ